MYVLHYVLCICINYMHRVLIERCNSMRQGKVLDSLGKSKVVDSLGQSKVVDSLGKSKVVDSLGQGKVVVDAFYVTPCGMRLVWKYKIFYQRKMNNWLPFRFSEEHG